MNDLNQLTQLLDKCETTAQLPQLVKQLNKCILQTLSSSDRSVSSDVCLLEAFQAMTRKVFSVEENLRNNASNSKAISLIIFDNMRQLLIKIDLQKLSLSKEIIVELLFMTIGSATENKCKLIELIIKISDSKSVEHLLNAKYNNFLTKSLLNKLKVNCKKDNDIDSRNAVIFEWLMSNMSTTTLEDQIHDIFPLTMRMIDEFSLQTKLIGLKALHKIVTICWSQLKTNGSDMLIFERLKTLLYNKDIEILEMVFECIYQVTDNYNASEEQESNKELVAFDRNDQIMSQLLNNISLSSDIKYRVIHLKFIDRFLVILKSSSIKYSKSYIKVLCDIIDEPICRKNCHLIEETIDSLNLFMRTTWIVIKEFFDKCLLSLIKLSINLNESDLSLDSKKILIQKINISILIMKNREKNTFAKLSEMIIQSNFKQELNESIINSFKI